MSFTVTFDDLRDIERLSNEIKRIVGDNIKPALDTALESKIHGREFDFLSLISSIRGSVRVMSIKMFIFVYDNGSFRKNQIDSKELDDSEYVRIFQENFEYYMTILEESGFLFGGAGGGEIVLVEK